MTTAWPRAAAPVADVWQELSRPTRAPEHFDPGALTDLPEPARRWLTHAIAPGTPLWRSAALRMHGHIRLGSWRPFRARQVLAPGAGYVWAATARFTGLPVIGYDRYDAGTADMRWRLCGLLPVVTATGPDVVRSAAGRLAAEGVVVPTAFRGAVWADGPTPDSATATWTSAGQAETIELHVAPGGQLESVVVRRWGNPLSEPYGRYPFGVELSQERTFGGVTIATRLRAGWFWGTSRWRDGEFFRAEITSASWR